MRTRSSARGVRSRIDWPSSNASRNPAKPGSTRRASTPSSLRAGGNAATTSPRPPVRTHGNSSAATWRTRSGDDRCGPPSPTRLALTPVPSRRGEGWRGGRDRTGARGSVLALVDQGVLLDPRHHRAQLLADLLDRVLGGAAAQCLEAWLAAGVFAHPFASA